MDDFHSWTNPKLLPSWAHLALILSPHTLLNHQHGHVESGNGMDHQLSNPKSIRISLHLDHPRSPILLFLLFCLSSYKTMRKCPVKNVMELSYVYLCPNWRQFGRNPHQIPRKLHVIYPDCTCFPSSNMTWILCKFKSWNFYGICQENDGISINFGVTLDQTAVKKTWEIPCHIFYRVWDTIHWIYTSLCIG